VDVLWYDVMNRLDNDESLLHLHIPLSVATTDTGGSCHAEAHKDAFLPVASALPRWRGMGFVVRSVVYKRRG